MEFATEPLGAMAAGALLGAGDLERGIHGDGGRCEGRVRGLGALVGVGHTGSLPSRAPRRKTWPSSCFILLGMICHCVPGGTAGRYASRPDHTSPRQRSAPGAAGARQAHLLFHHFGFLVNTLVTMYPCDPKLHLVPGAVMGSLPWLGSSCGAKQAPRGKGVGECGLTGVLGRALLGAACSFARGAGERFPTRGAKCAFG